MLCLADFDPLCRFLYFCGQPVITLIMIDSSKACKLLVRVEVQRLYAIERRSNVQYCNKNILNKMLIRCLGNPG